ncbi:RNA exonuclease 1 homolog isoform 2-T2 [Syngnathus typhle]
MFPASVLFSRVPCPFPKRSCKRPYCWYKHTEDGRRLFGYSIPPLRSLQPDPTGAQNDIQSTLLATQVADHTKNQPFQELECINKKIEMAKYEVEQEQRRLSCYRAAEIITLTEAKGKSSTSCKYVHRLSIKAPSPQSTKYVLDKSKPRTDLEYDPMSNFTAEFGSYKSINKALKGMSTHQGDVKKPVSHQVAPYHSLSPGIQDDNDPDDLLILDRPALPGKSLSQTCCDPDTHLKPVQEKSCIKDREASATNMIDLTECVEKSPDPKASISQYAEDATKRDAISDKSNQRLCVEVSKYLSAVRQTTEGQPPKKSGQESSCAQIDSHQVSAEASSLKEPLSEKAAHEDVIVIDSSSDEDEDAMAVELSDSDPVEECYRIFMEANNQEHTVQQQPEVPMETNESAKPNNLDLRAFQPHELPPKKRIAHEFRYAEVAAVKRRPQPKVLIPLQEPVKPSPASQLVAVVPKTQHVQQKAAILTADVNGAQVFPSSAAQRKQERWLVATSSSTPPVETASMPAPQQKACVNNIPPGSAIINVGVNLHLILPQGTLPLNSTSNAVTSVLTPITQVHLGSDKNVSLSAPMHRSTAPLLIPAIPRRRCHPSAAVSLPTPASETSSQVSVKPGAIPKRKAKQQPEAAKDKVPHGIRQCYVTKFTEVFLDTSANVDEAFKKALAEEKTVYSRSVNKLKYLSIAVNALKRLKKQNSGCSRDEIIHGKSSKGNIPLNQKQLKGKDDDALHEILRDYILSEEQLIESNYPIPHPEKPGYAILLANQRKGNNDPWKRMCCRCGATYSVNKEGKHTRMEECNYHYGKGVEKKVPGGVETRYSCCQGVMGAPGCQIFKLHVHDSLAMDGFMATAPRCPGNGCFPGVYALDCEMCYTIHGLELSRVTVVNSNLQVVYDTFVKPHNEVIDYNTRFSGISEEDMKDNQMTLANVQKTLLSFISADTILIGHGLETDLCALKLLHNTVVDTAVVFPHRLGPPHRLSLSSLTAEHLTRIIQESVCGHDTAEDAFACMELMLLKGKDGKMKK